MIDLLWLAGGFAGTTAAFAGTSAFLAQRLQQANEERASYDALRNYAASLQAAEGAAVAALFDDMADKLIYVYDVAIDMIEPAYEQLATLARKQSATEADARNLLIALRAIFDVPGKSASLRSMQTYEQYKGALNQLPAPLKTGFRNFYALFSDRDQSIVDASNAGLNAIRSMDIDGALDAFVSVTEDYFVIAERGFQIFEQVADYLGVNTTASANELKRFEAGNRPQFLRQQLIDSAAPTVAFGRDRINPLRQKFETLQPLQHRDAPARAVLDHAEAAASLLARDVQRGGATPEDLPPTQ